MKNVLFISNASADKSSWQLLEELIGEPIEVTQKDVPVSGWQLSDDIRNADIIALDDCAGFDLKSDLLIAAWGKKPVLVRHTKAVLVEDENPDNYDPVKTYVTTGWTQLERVMTVEKEFMGL